MAAILRQGSCAARGATGGMHDPRHPTPPGPAPCPHSSHTTAASPAPVIVTKYGSAIQTMRP